MRALLAQSASIWITEWNPHETFQGLWVEKPEFAIDILLAAT